MSSLHPVRAPASTERNFFLFYWVLSLAAVLFGFMLGLAPYLAGAKPWPPLAVHLHAALFYGWMAFFLVQIWLIRTKDIKTHMKLGLAGIGLGAAMTVIGTYMTLYMAKFHYLNGESRQLEFMIVTLSDMVSFPIFFAAAIAFRKIGATHKRLMLLATTVLLGAGFGRFMGRPLSQVFGDDTIFGFWFTLYLMQFLMMVGAMIYDLATRRVIHPAYLMGVPFVLAVQLFTAYVITSPAWPGFAKSLIGVS
jgi:hypothetical protein